MGVCASYHDEIPGVDKQDISHVVLPGQQALHINMQPLPKNHQPLQTRIHTDVKNKSKDKMESQTLIRKIWFILQHHKKTAYLVSQMSKTEIDKSMWNLNVLPTEGREVK